ncbi:non-ribosomal peptide synthetase [Paludibacterium paludis]|uniref:Pyoverdine synthetase D n=1 Tax=Paludibacterium paludis TaxID=1225769 RepID=A0A918P225_9NEIS|nr:non-ribosomal peptide synthetase [Paludibacterium paludis]GGY14790.1 pyoverdine synthetase D [Paludibacterium paludis]
MQATSYLFRPSFSQQRLWLLDQLEPASAHYNITTALRLMGDLDIPALEDAFNALLARHESLRTEFVYENEDVRQRCLETLTLPLNRMTAGADDKALIDAFLLAEYHTVFDLAKAPLIRCSLLTLAPRLHILAVTQHHIISDAVSAQILARELAELYRARRAGTPARLPELEIQYADYAEWQREQATGELFESQLAYWKRQLAGVAPLELPVDRIRPARQSFKGATLHFTVPSSVTEQLGQTARAGGASLFMGFLSVFYLLLYRYTGQQDLVVGTPVSGRTRLELENLVGFFVNTLALRVELDPEADFGELLNAVRTAVLDGQSNQDLPFDRVVDVLRPRRDLSHAPIFQAMFAYQESVSGQWQFEGLDVTPLDIPGDTAKFDLTLSLDVTGVRARGALEYSTDLFDTATMERFVGNYLALLGAVCGKERPPVADYPLPENEAAAGECAPLPVFAVTQCLHESFERQVRETPDADALSFAGKRLSYLALNARANRLAHYIRRSMSGKFAGPDALIGICLPRQEELVVAILAVQKAGFAYVPIDPTLSAERIGFYVTDSSVRLVVTLAEFSGVFDGLTCDAVCVDSEQPFIQSMPSDNLAGVGDPDRTAYVIYTSGSTGTPKGVRVTHRNVMRLFLSTERWFGFDRRDVWTLFHSTSFDFSVWEIWGALLYGGRLVVVPYRVSRSPEAFYQLLCDERVTVLNQTPSAFKLLMAADQSLAPQGGQLALRYVIFGGEALEPASLAGWVDKYGDLAPRLINMYGITETTVHASYRPITRADVSRTGMSPIGGALPDLRFHLFDSRRRPVPQGVIGEIYVEGAGVAGGYLNRPELTAERFVRWGDGGVLYRTGDLARALPDGSLEYKGRADHQVKVRGFRIELGEIESALRASGMAAEAVVTTWRDGSHNDVRLVAYVVPTGSGVKIDALREALKTRLPEYMQPASFVFLEALPLTANGKIDRRALPAPDHERPDLASDYAPPVSPAEQRWAEIWSAVLGFERIGVNDNFFALGGDSLRGVQVIARGRAQGLNASLVDLFERQTIAELAALPELAPEEGERRRVREPFDLISPEDRARLPATAIDAYPLSRMQGGMFYHMNMAPESNVYHCTGTTHIRLVAPFDEEAFREAVRRTVARHDVLRMSFDLAGASQPLQIIHSEAELPVVVEDLRELGHDEQEARIRALLESERVTPFDLSRPTLLRFFVQLRTDLSLQFTMTECHPIFDGWSYHTMIVEVFNRYAGLTGLGHFEEPAPLSVSYRDFIERELAAVADPAQQDFWSDKLEGCTVLRLPRLAGMREQGAVPSLKAWRLTLPDDVYAGLLRLMHAASVPMKSVLLAGHLKVMSLVTGEVDILTGIPVNGRPEEAGGDQLYGLFLNTLPFRFELSRGNWLDMVKAVFAGECECMPYRCFPLAEIQRRFGKEPLLPDVLFNYMDFHVYDRLDSHLGFEVVESPDSGDVNEGTNFALNVHFQHLTLSSRLRRNQVSIQLDYDETQLTRAQIEQLSGYYQDVFAAMAHTPGQRHWAEDFLPPLMRRQVLDAFARGREVEHDPLPLAALFAQAVSLYGDREALSDGTDTLSYRQLEERANRLSHCLKSRGVRKGECVALALGRSIDLVVAVLATIKAEAVYMPVDADDPRERVEDLVRDAGVRCLVTSASRFGKLEGMAAAVLALGSRELDDELDEMPATALPVTIDASAPVYVMYTSGSTGKPKGVLVRHKGVVRLVKDVGYADFTRHGRILMVSNVCFDASTMEIWGALLNGGFLAIYPDALPSLPVLETVIARHGVQTAFLTASLFNMVVDERPQLLAPLRQLITGGEAMSPAHAAKVLALLPGLRLINGYGPTENTTFTTTYEVAGEGLEGAGSVPIGRPIENTRVYVLDRFMNPVPVGTPGELFTGGDGLAIGYLGSETLTAERFVSDPFRPGDGEARLYRTGDRVRYLPDGSLHFLGRMDRQVKIRGFRIETGEIESVLGAHPEVRQAVVRVVEDAAGKSLAAYVVPAASLGGDPTPLKHYLARRLPAYMQPSHLVFLDSLPLTQSGKLDTGRLPAPVREVREASRTLALSSREERDIQEIWSDVLGIAQPGLDENFFDLAGHSLLLMRVHQSLLARGYSGVSIIDLLNYPTIHTLARRLQGGDTEGAEVGAVGKIVEEGRHRLARLLNRKQGH